MFVNRPQRLAWRRALVSVHRWTGLVLGLYVIFISVTGALLVLRNQVRPVLGHLPASLDRHYPGVTRHFSYDAMVHAVSARFPRARVSEIDVERAGGVKIQIYAAEPDRGAVRGAQYLAAMDPRDDSIAVAARTSDTLMDSVWSWHVTLLAGDTGERVNGILALVLLVSTLSGIVVWWPGIARWARGFGIAWRKNWKRTLFDSHAAVGFWVLVPLLAWSLSGAEIVYRDAFKHVVGPIAPFSLDPAKSSWRPGDPLVSIDRTIAAMHVPARFGTSYESGVELPQGAGDVLAIDNSISAFDAGESFDPKTGVRMATGGHRPGDVLVGWLTAFHFGSLAAGTRFDYPVMAAWTVLGLAPALLAISGAVLFFARLVRRVKRRRMEQREPLERRGIARVRSGGRV